ncbi:MULTISPECIES: ATP-binding protein [unclassified Siphonobacter]|uniref:sensor histidine kinase n=1 Tax=unclassified Siphonobacter TaxID=2635712 RepID=UPI000CA76A71|nr:MULTISPECIES: ATP-binding protein [unclassified Siphonobacter]MDQ1086753.1 signal transduction histidine kinase [Siphonobacter sp. SORGH_AS_1065]PKK36262.1 hypothetical protein BWI96_12760 [Siphonobacter sp. SORGH_AS_0500]
MSQLYDSTSYLREAESLLQFGTFDWEIGQSSIHWSRGLYDVFNIPTHDEEVLNFDWYIQQILEPDRQHTYELIQEAIDNQTSFRAQYRVTNYEGKELVLLSQGRTQVHPVTGKLHLVGITADLTAKVQYQQELENKMQALDQSNFELEQFAYIASHDLQEPLRKITSFGERINSKYRENLGDEGAHYLTRMLGATQRMKLLIDSLLSYSRASRPEEPFTPVQLQDVVKNVLSDFELRIAETQASVSIGSLPTILALPTQMHQLFQNLIGNALKFNSPERSLTITINSLPASRQEIAEARLPVGQNFHKLTIADNGIGFESKYSEQIFTLFKRLHGRSEYEGAGMGLAICKRIVENHGGAIYATSQSGQGTTFVLLLPEQQVTVI